MSALNSVPSAATEINPALQKRLKDADRARAKIDDHILKSEFGKVDGPPKIALQSLQEFVQKPTLSSLVRGVVTKGSFVVVFGPPKGGKTFSVCDLMMHAAHGLDWHGCAIKRRQRVVYLAGEGISGLRVRLKAWIEFHDTVEGPSELWILPMALSMPDRTVELTEALRALRPDIVVTDTLNAYFGGGDENSTQDMSAFCASVRYLRDTLDCSVIVIHHTGHGDSGRERGSIVLRASADVLIQVAKDENNKDLVGFQVIAARDMEPMESAIALRLVRHETEWVDEDQQPLVSCIVSGADQPVTLPGRGGKPLGSAQSTVLQCAQRLAAGKSAGDNGEVILPRMDVASAAKDCGISKQSISSAWQSLAERGLIRLLEPGSLSIRVRTT